MVMEFRSGQDGGPLRRCQPADRGSWRKCPLSDRAVIRGVELSVLTLDMYPDISTIDICLTRLRRGATPDNTGPLLLATTDPLIITRLVYWVVVIDVIIYLMYVLQRRADRVD